MEMKCEMLMKLRNLMKEYDHLKFWTSEELRKAMEKKKRKKKKKKKKKRGTISMANILPLILAVVVLL